MSASGTWRRNPSTMPSPARRIATTATGSAGRDPSVSSSGVVTLMCSPATARTDSEASTAAASAIARRKASRVVVAVRSTARWRASSGWSTTRTSAMPGAPYPPRGRATVPDGMTDARRNLELKARDDDPQATRAAAIAAGAIEHGVLRQRDTYFSARAGRLKLREQRPGGAQLIAYERSDEAQERESRYRLADVPDPAPRRAALAAALGITVVVEKERHLLLADSVRIHLDHVEGLGQFVE